jgi:hypothetical protein
MRNGAFHSGTPRFRRQDWGSVRLQDTINETSLFTKRNCREMTLPFSDAFRGEVLDVSAPRARCSIVLRQGRGTAMPPSMLRRWKFMRMPWSIEQADVYMQSRRRQHISRISLNMPFAKHPSCMVRTFNGWLGVTSSGDEVSGRSVEKPPQVR